MIPSFKMGFYHQKEYLERPFGIHVNDKLGKKASKDPMDGFEYSTLFASKTYSILSYIVGGFVGSKSQMNNNKHNLSYDLSAAIFNLLNPCKYERDKSSLRKNGDNNLYGAAPKSLEISSQGYSKYIVKSSHRDEKMNLELEWLAALPILEESILSFSDQNSGSSQPRKDSPPSLGPCAATQGSTPPPTITDSVNSTNCHCDSLDVTDRVSNNVSDTSMKGTSSHSPNYLATERFRQQSECSVESTDSESFIFFDPHHPDVEEVDQKDDDKCFNFELYDFDSEDGNDDGCEDDSSCEYDICSVDKELAEANHKWLKNYKNVETKEKNRQTKVRFNEDVKINKIVAWDFAYRAARPGPWEQMARDRVRFRERILRLSPTISPILSKEHRDKVYNQLYS